MDEPEMHFSTHNLDSDVASIASSELSTTSTVMFEHEPFATFQNKVMDLCRHQWPSLTDEAFEVTPMSGGSYNRVIGVKVLTSKTKATFLEKCARRVLESLSWFKPWKSQAQEYVVRIPRSADAWVEHNVAILLFVGKFPMPTPEITSFSLSSNNPLGSPFMFQPRLPGRSVQEIYPELNTSQRISLARDIGTALQAMSNIHSPSPGTIDPESILTNSPSLKVLQLPNQPLSSPPSTPNPQHTLSTPLPIHTFLQSHLHRQQAHDLSLHRASLNPWPRFSLIITKLHSLGYFTSPTYSLTHMDFEPRNLLAHVTSPTTAILSGILDWDEAIFAPAFLNCTPPSWLWDLDDSEDEELDEAVAHVTPADPDLAAIKGAFEQAVGETYLTYAYTKEWRIARRICRLAVTGIGSNEDYGVVERVLAEWNEGWPEWGVRGLWDFGGDGEGDGEEEEVVCGVAELKGLDV